MHLKRLTEAARTIALRLAEHQAAAVHLYEHTLDMRPRTPLERLELLMSREEETKLRSGCVSLHPEGLRQFLQTELWHKRRNGFMSSVSRPPPES